MTERTGGRRPNYSLLGSTGSRVEVLSSYVKRSTVQTSQSTLDMESGDNALRDELSNSAGVDHDDMSGTPQELYQDAPLDPANDELLQQQHQLLQQKLEEEHVQPQHQILQQKLDENDTKNSYFFCNNRRTNESITFGNRNMNATSECNI